MVIKKKDGSVYRLQGPNPIMKKQAFWENEDSLVHNFNPQEIITIPSGKEEKKEIPLQDIPPEEIHVQIKDIDPNKLQNVTKKKILKEVPKVNVHVLPSVIQESYDSLYDETRSTLGYGQKFIVEIVIARQGDINAVFWTNGKEISKGSIIYVPTERRWWRVQETSNRAGGWLMDCTPSDFQPSFE